MDKMELYERKFKLWFYQVSHSEAIIRSPKMDGNKVYDKNIDIYVGDIDYIEMPCILQELWIDKATQDDVAYLRQKCNKDITVERIVVFVSEGRRYYVVASIIKIMENDLDFATLPIYAFIKNSQE